MRHLTQLERGAGGLLARMRRGKRADGRGGVPCESGMLRAEDQRCASGVKGRDGMRKALQYANELPMRMSMVFPTGLSGHHCDLLLADSAAMSQTCSSRRAATKKQPPALCSARHASVQ